MQVSKILVALSIAAGFASASFAQGTATPVTLPASAAKVAAPAPTVSEKKTDALKAAEPAKVEAAAKSEASKVEAAKPAEKHAKAKEHEHTGEKLKGEKHEAAEAKAAEVKAEIKAQAKPVANPVPGNK